VSEAYIKEFIPNSWFHPKGIYKVLKRFRHRLPNVSGCLFATFTIDREAMRAQGYGPSESFDITRDRIRKIFFLLRKGVEWEGKVYTITSEYCTKVEFHDDPEGWPHFHIIWLTRRFVPADLLASLWGFGRTNVQRINNDDFQYLLKYVCKSGGVPEWVQDRKRMRIFQPSRGFLKPLPSKKATKGPEAVPKKRKSTTLRERLHKWEHRALFVIIDDETELMTCREMPLHKPFKETFDHLVYAVALDGRYLGNGKIKIDKEHQLYPWIQKPHQNTTAHS
jgi:hypothetical protein